MTAPDPVFRFGSFTLDAARGELRRGDAPVALGARALDLLAALLRRRGALAPKDALLAEVWGDRVVEENNLAAQVSALRRVLGADPALRRALVTVPGRGYRFLAEAAPAPAAAPPRTLTIVVLPFAVLGMEASEAWFAEGLAEVIGTDLSRIAGLRVIAAATAAALPPGAADPVRVGAALGVDHVLAGSVQRGAGRLRVNARLAEAGSGVLLWSDRFDGDAADPLALQDRITARIANALGREIFVAAAQARRGGDPGAFDLLLRGIAADNRPQSLETLRAQEVLFAGAIERDPDLAEAHARLARAILLQANQVHAADPPAEVLARGIAAAERALALDPHNARAHCAVGLVHVLRRDFASAALANEAAIERDPNHALAHNNLGNALVHLGDGAGAAAAAERALRLDPRGPQAASCWTTIGFARLLLGQHDAALSAFARARATNPRLPRAQAGAAVALALGHEFAAARRAARELLDLAPHYRLGRTMDGCPPGAPAAWRRFYAEVLEPGARAAGLPV
jgi:TolB-like protein/cytochrome c-type biogenesis protein CcmH/NrfG